MQNTGMLILKHLAITMQVALSESKMIFAMQAKVVFSYGVLIRKKTSWLQVEPTQEYPDNNLEHIDNTLNTKHNI